MERNARKRADGSPAYFFWKCPAKGMYRRRTVSEKPAETAADEWQIIAAAFVGQEYRGMQSLCAGSAEGRQLLAGVEGEKSSAG